MKRVRDGGGARDQLRDEGIVIFGDYAGDQLLAAALGLPRPGPGEFVSARLVRRSGVAVGAGSAGAAGAFRASGAEGGRGSGGGREGGYDRRFIRLDRADWVLAGPADPLGPAPGLPRLSGSAARAVLDDRRIVLMRVAGDAPGCWRHRFWPGSGRHDGRLCLAPAQGRVVSASAGVSRGTCATSSSSAPSGMAANSWPVDECDIVPERMGTM